MHLGKYLVDASLDLVTKLQKYTPFAYTCQLGFPSKGVFLFSCISLHVYKKSTFAFKFAINIIRCPPPKIKKKEKSEVLVTKMFHSLAYDRIQVSTFYTFFLTIKPSFC